MAQELTYEQRLLLSRHATYDHDNLGCYRLTLVGGAEYIAKYLLQHHGEPDAAWQNRKKLTYNSRCSAVAVEELARGISLRSAKVTRTGGDDLFRAQIRGENGGVDGMGSTMNTFMSREVVLELLAMGRVGVFCDRKPLADNTLAIANRTLPYYYAYKAEDILNWTYDRGQITALLVRAHDYFNDPISGLGGKATITYYHYQNLPDGDGVAVVQYDEKANILKTETLDLPTIPFTLFELPYSLLHDIAAHQKALLNLSSADVFYSWAANYPFFTQQKPSNDMAALLERRTSDLPTAADALTRDEGRVPESDITNRVNVGAVTGMTYPMGAERPDFINPSPDPLKVSMQKQTEIKNELRAALLLSVSSLDPKQASAESKASDKEGAQSGLSYIGMILQTGETMMAGHWHMYRRSSAITVITYPETYDLITEEERRKEATELLDLQLDIASPTYQRAVAVQAANILLRDKVSEEVMRKIRDEIMSSPYLTSDPDIIMQDVEAGLVSKATGSKARGYADGEAVAAEKEFVARAIEIAKAQSAAAPAPPGGDPGARGIPDLSTNPKASSAEKKNKRKRGRGKGRAANPPAGGA